ncbi:unnamed protein product [Diatraea saccharalis]|uniref:Uncharacterized protein n=1 Tax=Diatraea saccharalis TaxID=40085 RepID=A0A9N9R176_9NEOP|nr:unnamed protein product [Diatraea saccharalis]
MKSFHVHSKIPPNVPQLQVYSENEPLKIVIDLPSLDDAVTETTTMREIPLAVPIPMPAAVQMAVPAIPAPEFCQEKHCPACPPCLCAPSCTPSFFSYCSRCHQKCRCRKIEDVPQPMPLNPPKPLPGPVFALPAPLATPLVVLPHNLFKQKWTIVTIFLRLFQQINSQIPMPMIGIPGPQIFAMPPPPIHVAVAIPVEIKKTTRKTTTTTTTEKTLAFAVPVPMPMAFGMPVAPPPPPPMPIVPPPPMPIVPPPVVVVPFPPIRRHPIIRPPYTESSSSESCGRCSGSRSSSDSSSSDCSYRRKRYRRQKGKYMGIKGKKMRKGRKHIGKLNKRRNFVDYSSSKNNEFAKPVLTYISKNGKVKIKKHITHDQAESLLNDNETEEENRNQGRRVQIVSRKTSDDPSRVLVVSSSDGEAQPQIGRHMVLRSGASSHVLSEGKKQLVFKPPDFKKIANLSVSFQVV